MELFLLLKKKCKWGRWMKGRKEGRERMGLSGIVGIVRNIMWVSRCILWGIILRYCCRKIVIFLIIHSTTWLLASNLTVPNRHKRLHGRIHHKIPPRQPPHTLTIPPWQLSIHSFKINRITSTAKHISLETKLQIKKTIKLLT